MLTSFVLKRKVIYLSVVLVFIWIWYQYTTGSSLNQVKNFTSETRRSDEDVKNEIANELRKMLLDGENQHIRSKETFPVVENRKLLSNPNSALHLIKRPQEIKINKTALDEYISILEEKNKRRIVKVLTLQDRAPKQPPSSNAPIFMQDLPYRWSIGQFLLTPWKIEKRFTSKPPFMHECYLPPNGRWNMIAVVKSWVVNRKLRIAIRETWGLVRTISGSEIHVVFLLAKAPSEKLQEEIKEENNKFGDLLQVDATEDLQYFTIRSVAGLTWVSKHFPSDFIYSSLDDNMMPHLHNLVPLIDEHVRKIPKLTYRCTPESVFPFLCGYSFRAKDRPNRKTNSPWALLEDLYPPKVLPPHCQGGLYTTSVSTVNLIVKTATKTYPSHFDAVWITGIIRQKLGLKQESIVDVTKTVAEKKIVEYLEKNIDKNIREIWANNEELVKNQNVVFRTDDDVS